MHVGMWAFDASRCGIVNEPIMGLRKIWGAIPIALVSFQAPGFEERESNIGVIWSICVSKALIRWD